MADAGAILFIVAFFAVAVLFVHACERIIGPDLEAGATESETETEPQQAAA